MRLDEIRKGFWGYRQEDVRRFAAQLEAEAQAKCEEALHRQREESDRHAAQLEEALRSALEENETLRAEQASVGDTLLQAQKYAQKIREEADEFERDAQARVQASVDRQLQELESYSAAADALKEQLHQLLKDTLGKTEDIKRELNILHGQGPDAGLTGAASPGETGGW